LITPDEVVNLYEAANFGIVLPLPTGKKKPPPTGYTGIEAQYATRVQASHWLDKNIYGNFCLRMPPGVLGVDYDSRKGGSVFPWLEARLDEAPRSSARGGADPSGIYFFLVPADMLPELRDWHLAEFGTEAVRPGHRYAVVWPSINPMTNTQYRWYAAGSTDPMDGVPDVAGFPEIGREELRATMEKAAKARQPERTTGSTLAGPKRKIEASELGGLKALLAGYSAYDLTPTSGMAKLRAKYEAKRIAEVTDDLEDLTASSEAWEPSVGGLALKLFSIALAPWSRLTVEAAHDLVVQHGPTCEKATELGVHSHSGRCWNENNLDRRAERSLGQHDGAWTQLPGNLRGKTAPGERESREHASGSVGAAEMPDEVDGDDDWGVTPSGGSGGDSDDGDDDFFDDSGEPDDDTPKLVWLTDEVPIDDPPDPIAGGLAFSGVFNIVSAAGGVGKSTVVSRVCADTPGKTLWLSSEEAQSSIHQRACVLGSQDFAVFSRVVSINDRAHIVEALEGNPDITKVVLDNLQSFFSLGDKSNFNNAVRESLSLLYDYTLKRGITLIGITHPPKAGMSTVQGSGAWEEVARHLIAANSMYLHAGEWQVQATNADSQHYVLLRVAKSNYYRHGGGYWLVRTRRMQVPRLTVSGQQTEDWVADFMDDDLAAEAYEAWLASTLKKTVAKKSDLPPVDNPASLLTGYWAETDQLATQIGVPVNKIVSSLARYELIATKVAGGRLIFVNRADEQIENPTIELGTFDIPGLMARLNVTQQVHLLWILSHLGVEADIRGDDTVVITRPEQDETEAALLDAGLGDLG
jgi:hypothetical protein